MFKWKQKDSQPVDVTVPKKQNIFENNELYFQKCKDLEEQVSYLRSLNQFLVSQILQNFSSRLQPTTQKPELTYAIRKKSAQFDDDKSLNRTFQLFKIFKGVLDDGSQALRKISTTFFPSNFDFETAYLNKNYQTIINLLLKSSINSLISLKEALVEQEQVQHNKVLGAMGALGGKYLLNEARAAKGSTKLAGPPPKVLESTMLLMKGVREHFGDDKSFYSGEDRKQFQAGYKAYSRGGMVLSKFMVEDKSPNDPKWQCSLSDGLSLSQNKMTDGPMLSDSFLNATEIKNHFLKPFELQVPQPAPLKVDQATQVSFQMSEEKHPDTNSFYQPDSGGNGNDSQDHFTPI